MDRKICVCVCVAEMGFLLRVAGLRDRVRSSAIREGLGVEPLLLVLLVWASDEDATRAPS